jgi:hypothetical protein
VIHGDGAIYIGFRQTVILGVVMLSEGNHPEVSNIVSLQPEIFTDTSHQKRLFNTTGKIYEVGCLKSIKLDQDSFITEYASSRGSFPLRYQHIVSLGIKDIIIRFSCSCSC